MSDATTPAPAIPPEIIEAIRAIVREEIAKLMDPTPRIHIPSR